MRLLQTGFDNGGTNFELLLVTHKIDYIAEGIDTFAVIVKHELFHREQYQKMWKSRGGWPLRDGWFDLNGNDQLDMNEIGKTKDQDLDLIPKLEESWLTRPFAGGFKYGQINHFDNTQRIIYKQFPPIGAYLTNTFKLLRRRNSFENKQRLRRGLGLSRKPMEIMAVAGLQQGRFFLAIHLQM